MALFRARFGASPDRAAENTGPLVWLARLLFDSRRLLTSAAAPAFARSADPGAAVVQQYAAGPLSVELWQEWQEDGNWYLICQVLPFAENDAVGPAPPGDDIQPPPAFDEARLYPAVADQSAASPAAHISTRQGEAEFHFEAVPPGTYTLRLRSGVAEAVPTELVVTPLVVGVAELAAGDEGRQRP
jgi:hypothetical protein